MPFVHAPIFWLGLGLVSLPIIIHLLNRRRFRVRPWAAMQFLLESLRRNRRRLRIEELILLALRCLVLLALALAVARLFSRSDLPGSSDTHTPVFVLDDTVSMGQKVGSTPIFRAAVDDMIEQIRKLPKSSKVAVLLASAPPSAQALFGLDLVENLDPDDLKRRLDAMKPSDRRVSLADVLAKAARAFAGKEGDRRLWILSDFRTEDLRPEGQARAIRAEFEALTADRVELVFMDYGRKPHDNLTIKSIKLLDRFAIAHTYIRVAVTVRNNAGQESARARLTGSVRFAPGDEYPSRTAGEAGEAMPLEAQAVDSIPAGASETFICEMKPTRTGAAVLSVALGDDELPGDNKAHLVLNIRPALRALIVDGRPEASDPEESESWAYRLALDPNGTGNRGVAAKTVSIDALGDENLSSYDVIALLDVGELTSVPDPDGGPRICPDLRRLERYVRDGGGLVVYTGESLNTTFYNGPFHAGGLGLSPFRLAEPLRTETFFRLDPKSIVAQGPMAHFHGVWAFNTELIRFMAITPAEETSGAAAGDVMPARVLARFNNGRSSPAVAIRQFGKGAAVMVYSAAGNRRWNTWARDGDVYVPSVMDTVLYIARPQQGRGGQLVGEPIVHRLASKRAGLHGSLKTPDYPEAPSVALVSREGFTPAGRTSLSELAGRMGAAGAGSDESPPNEDLARAGRDARRALADNDMAAMETTLKAARDVLKGARGHTGPAGLLYADIAGRLEAGLEEMFGRQLRFERTDRCGIYELTVPPDGGTTTFFARNGDPAEGALAHNGEDDIVAAVDSKDFIYKERSAAASAADISATTDTKEYWLWAMGALLALLAIETFLAQRFGHYDLKKS